MTNTNELIDAAQKKLDAKNFDGAIADCDEAIKRGQRNAEIYFIRGVAINGKLQKNNAQNDESVFGQNLTNRLIDVAQKKLDTKDFDGAIDDCDVVIKKDPDKVEAYFIRGVANNAKSQSEDAINDFNKTISLNPNHAKAYFYRATAKEELNRLEDAICDYNEAFRLNPQLGEEYYQRSIQNESPDKLKETNDEDNTSQRKINESLRKNQAAITHSKEGRHDRALKEFGDAIQLNPYEPILYFNRGNTKFYMGIYEEAISDFDIALQLDPNFEDAYKKRDFLRRMRNRNKDPVQEFDLRIQDNPEDAAAFYLRGRLKCLRKNFVEALADFDETIRLEPKHENAYMHRGLTKQFLGMHEEAVYDFIKAEQINPRNARTISKYRKAAEIQLAKSKM